MRSLNAAPDPDGVVRRIPTFLSNIKPDGTRNFVPSMALELARRVANRPFNRTNEGGLVIGGSPAPGVSDDMLLVNFNAHTRSIPTFSFADLYACAKAGRTDFFEQNFKDRVVLLGLVLDIEDRKLSSNRFATNGGPIGPEVKCLSESQSLTNGSNLHGTMSGVYLHAAAIENLLSDTGLQTYSLGQQSMWTFLSASLISVSTMLLSLWGGIVFLVGALSVWTVVSVVEFSRGLQHPLLVPLATGTLSFAVALVIRFLLLDRQARFLRQAFASYVAPDLVKELEQNPSQLRLGGERREMSFLFTDLAGFTSLVEGLSPEQGGRILNAYLDGMIDIAKSKGGTIDKVIGDAVVVLFAAPVLQPSHAEQALACALAMDDFAVAFAAQQKLNGIPFGDTRIGVHSGAAIIGNFGGSGFFDYTAHGDAVNTAARLESVNKQLGTRIAVSGATVRQCSTFEGRAVGSLILKGKANQIDVFAPTHGDWADNELQSRYERAYVLMAEGGEQALEAFQSLQSDFPDDPLSRFHCARLMRGETGAIIALDEK